MPPAFQIIRQFFNSLFSSIPRFSQHPMYTFDHDAVRF